MLIHIHTPLTDPPLFTNEPMKLVTKQPAKSPMAIPRRVSLLIGEKVYPKPVQPSMGDSCARFDAQRVGHAHGRSPHRGHPFA